MDNINQSDVLMLDELMAHKCPPFSALMFDLPTNKIEWRADNVYMCATKEPKTIFEEIVLIMSVSVSLQNLLINFFATMTKCIYFLNKRSKNYEDATKKRRTWAFVCVCACDATPRTQSIHSFTLEGLATVDGFISLWLITVEDRRRGKMWIERHL